MKSAQNKLLNQTRNKRGLIFMFGLYARWLVSAFQNNIEDRVENDR